MNADTRMIATGRTATSVTRMVSTLMMTMEVVMEALCFDEHVTPAVGVDAPVVG